MQSVLNKAVRISLDPVHLKPGVSAVRPADAMPALLALQAVDQPTRPARRHCVDRIARPLRFACEGLHDRLSRDHLSSAARAGVICQASQVGQRLRQHRPHRVSIVRRIACVRRHAKPLHANAKPYRVGIRRPVDDTRPLLCVLTQHPLFKLVQIHNHPSLLVTAYWNTRQI